MAAGMISEAYGHKHIDTTIKYLNLVDDQLMEASDQYYANILLFMMWRNSCRR